MCGRGLPHALCQVDHGPAGADQGGGDAVGTQRAGGHKHSWVGQLHMRGHLISGHDRGHSPGHRKRWELLFKSVQSCGSNYVLSEALTVEIWTPLLIADRFMIALIMGCFEAEWSQFQITSEAFFHIITWSICWCWEVKKMKGCRLFSVFVNDHWCQGLCVFLSACFR